MDFQINIQTDFEMQAEQFLYELLERGYSQATVNGYRSYLNRIKKYILSLPEPMYTDKIAHKYVENIVPYLPVGASSKKYKDSIRPCKSLLQNNEDTGNFEYDIEAQSKPKGLCYSGK